MFHISHLPETSPKLLKIVKRIEDDEDPNKRLKERASIHESRKPQDKDKSKKHVWNKGKGEHGEGPSHKGGKAKLKENTRVMTSPSGI